MKNISKLLLILSFSLMIFPACDTLLDVDSDRHIFEEDYGMKSSNDTLYSMFGVYSQLQKLADSYVVLGELRGDLMDVNQTADRFLKEVYNFDFSENNPYSNNEKDYYAVINNANYIIHNIDTSVVRGGVKVMYKVYAAAKAIRAWTYMQAMLNFGDVSYYEKPILSLEEALIEPTKITDISALADILIQDLQPWKSVENPYFGSLGAFDTDKSFFPIRFILGDLYLWKGDYANAANEYRDLMYYNQVLVTNQNRSTYEAINNAFTGRTTNLWRLNFAFTSSEMLTNIMSSNEYGVYITVDSLMEQRYLLPSDYAMNLWKSQHYVHAIGVDTLGDLRGVPGSVATSYELNDMLEVEESEMYYITKYRELNPENQDTKQIMTYRAATLYLRYAEAVNRMGKPNLAMVVMKYGLKSSSINAYVPETEIDSVGDALANYMDFTDLIFANNYGIRYRGLGNVQVDTTYFVIPRNMLDQDSIITYVEDLIVNEYALETAFEGNRFHDLMRVAMRRNDNAYLANQVAEKYGANKEAIRSKLMDRANWFVR